MYRSKATAFQKNLQNRLREYWRMRKLDTAEWGYCRMVIGIEGKVIL